MLNIFLFLPLEELIFVAQGVQEILGTRSRKGTRNLQKNCVMREYVINFDRIRKCELYVKFYSD
jgi:hypothetical protein